MNTRSPIPTRRSLLARIKDSANDESWREFYGIYQKVVYNLARRTGLTEDESQDVVQDTFCQVARKMPEFQYDPAIGSFKNWILHTAYWHIQDQFRHRLKNHAPKETCYEGSTECTSVLEQIPDPKSCRMNELSELAWKEGLREAALQRIKRRVKPKQYQAFDLAVFKEMPVEQIMALLGLSRNQVYLAKLRISRLVADEVTRLQRDEF